MHGLRSLFALVAALALLAGCGTSGPERSIDDPTNSLVFGYVDMSEAPTQVQAAWLQQLAPPTEAPYWRLGVKDGVFHSVYVPPGMYQISRFYGSGFFAGEHNYNFPRQGNSTAVKIDKPGIYFLGSFKYKAEKSGFFEPGKFSMERTSKPTEAELLARILDDSEEIKASPWADRIRARIRQGKK